MVCQQDLCKNLNPFVSPALFVILISPFIGSFIGNLAVRMPEGRSVLAGRSVCPNCAGTLRAVDLVPVLSWLKLRRRCFYCDASISAFYPIIELSTVIIAIWSAQLMNGWMAAASFGFGCILLVLAIIDARHYWLPDALTLPLIPAGILTGYLYLHDRLSDHFIGAAAGFLGFYLISKLYRQVYGRDGLGLGDAKLLAGIGAWVTWAGLPYVVGLGACCGLGFVACRSVVTGGKVDPQARIPFGPFLALAGWLIWLYNPAIIVTGLS